jgi:hypothetical protein
MPSLHQDGNCLVEGRFSVTCLPGDLFILPGDFSSKKMRPSRGWNSDVPSFLGLLPQLGRSMTWVQGQDKENRPRLRLI